MISTEDASSYIMLLIPVYQAKQYVNALWTFGHESL